MANLDSLYDKVLNEAWSKTIAGNGKNTLLVHTQAEFKPEDIYYVFVCQLSKVSERYAWVTGDRAIDFSVGGNEENWKNLRIIEDRLIKGSDVISYIKNKENKILSGLTQYILDIKYIDPAVKDAIFASLQINTKSGPGRFEVGFYFVNANIAGQPDLKTYYNIVKTLRDKSKDATLEPIQIAAQTLPYIDDLIKAGELNKKNAELTGGDWNPAGLLEAINWDDPYPYGKIDSIVTSTIKFYNPDFTDADVKDAYSAFYGWLQKHEDLPDETGVQEWYDNAVENFRDADQRERSGMDEDEEAAAEEGYIDAAENLLIQQLNAFFNGDSEEYKDFLNARALNKKNAEITGGDWNPTGLLESLQFDAGSEYFNYVDFCKEQGWSDEEIAEFSEWFATKSDMAEDINDYGDPEDTEAWWKVGSYFDAAIENAGYDAREHQDPTILHDYINDVKVTIARYYRQFKDYKQAQSLNQKNAAATGGDWEPEGLLEGEEICEQATLNPNGELRFGKYRIFQAGSGTQTAPYAQAINNTNLFSKRLADDVKILETFGFKFNTVYYYQPPPRRDGKYVSRAIAMSGTDNNGEEILWVRKGGYQAPSPVVYYKDRRGGNVKEIAHDIAVKSKSLTAVSVEDFFKAAVSPTRVSTAGGGYAAKKTKLRPDGKYDVTGVIYLKKDYTRVLVGKPFVINSLDELPIKFGVVRGRLNVELPVNNVNWFPEKFDGELRFDVESGMLPEKFLELGLLDRVTDNTSISFETSEKGKYGLPIYKDFKSKADWIDTIKAHELNKKNAEITGGDWNPAGLLEAANTDGRVTEFVKALIEVDNFEDFKRIAKQLPDLSNTINGTPAGLLIQYAIFDNIGPLQGDGSNSLWRPSTPQDFFYKALYYYIRYHSSDTKSSRAFNKSLSYRQGPPLEEVEQAFNKWLDSKQAKDLEKKNAAATGGDWNPAGLLESWTDKDIEDYWEHYYNVGDPGPIGAIKNWPGLSFFNSWFVDMIDRENWNVDSIEDYFIEYSDRVADNLEQKDNEDRGYGELQEIACYRGYKKLYSYYRQFLSDTNSPFYKDWKATEELNKKNAAATGGDWNPAGLLESKSRNNIGKWVSIMLKAAEEAAQDPKALAMAPNKARTVSADFWTSIPPSDGSIEGIRENFLNAIKQAQNFDIQNGNFSPAKNKFKKMKYDPKRLGSLPSGYQIYVGDLSSPEAQKEIKKDFIYKANTALFYRMEAVAEKEYPGNRWYTIIGPLVETGNIIKDFIKGDLKEIKDFLKDYLDAQELDKKNAAVTGGDWNPSGLLEQGESASKKPYVTEFNSIITKAKDARTFNEFEAAFEGTDPNIWKLSTTGKFFHKVFVAYFNSEPLVTINSKNDYERTKFGHLNEAINHYGEYLLLSRTDAEADRFSGEDARSEAAFVYRKQAENYFNKYIDIINAEELDKKNAAATGGDWNPAGLLEAYIWTGFSNEYLTDSFTKLIKKAATANTFEEFLAAHDDVDPKIWSTAKAESSYFKTFQHIFNVDLYKDKDGIRGNFIGVDTKLGALYRAIQRMGFYTVAAKTDHNPWHHNVGTKEYRIKSDLESAKKYFDTYKDIVDAEELNKKNAAATGGDWEPAGLLESNKVFNPEIYDIYKKALEANSFEEFKKLIKQLPDPWKYEVMVGGGANARAIIKDILELKDIPSSYSPKTPADHFLTAVDHIQDVEHSSSVTLDDIRSGYAYAQEHFAKWLDYKKAKELEQKNVGVTGGDWNPAGLLESQEQDNVTPERDKTLFFGTVENFKKYLPEISDADLIGFYDWFNNVKRVELGFGPHAPDNESSWGVFQQITYVAAEDEFGIPEHEIPDEFRSVAEMTMEKLYDEYKAHLVNKKNADVTGGDWNPAGLLQEANSVSHDKRFALMKWARAIPNSNEFARQWALKSGFSEEDIENFGGQEWLIDGLIDWFTDVESDKTKYQGGKIYDMSKLSLEQQIALYQKLEDDAVEEVKNHLEELYKDWMAAIELNKKNANVTGGDWDPKGLLEAKQYTGPLGPVKDKQGKEHDYQGWYNIIKPFIIDLLKAVENNDFSSFIKIVDSRQKNMGGPGFNPYFNLVDKVYAKVLMELLNNEQAENAFDEAYSTVQSMIVYIDVHLKGQWDRDPNTLQHIPHAQIKQEYPRAVTAFNKFKDFLDAKELDKKNAADTGGDWNPAGLLEAKSKSTPEQDKYWGDIIYDYINKLVNANTFEEFMGLVEEKPATFQFNRDMYYHDKIFVNAIDSILGSHDKETGNPVRSSFVAAFSAIQGFVSYIDLFYNKEETSPLLEKHRAETEKKFDQWLQTRADWYAAQELNKKNAAATGGDWNPAGLLESDDELDDITHERYWDNALEATATDWVNSFRSYIGLELANKIYTWMLNKARVKHDSQATYNNLIDMYGKFADERKKKDGLNNWVEPDTAKVLADIVDAYNADQVEQRNAAATGGDWDPKGLL